MQYFSQTIDKTLKDLQTTADGLSENEAARRLEIYGKNQTKVRKRPLWKTIIEPFADVFMLVLMVAAVLSIIHHEPLDAGIIIAIMAASALIFYAQTYSTQKVLRTLEKNSAQTVSVMRDGREQMVDISDLVPGDIVHLSEGEKVPADGRVIDSHQLRVNESQLTGESEAVPKRGDAVAENAQIYERSSMVYQGSFVIGGAATFVVTATGSKTEFGMLAALVKKDELVSPIQKKIDKLLGQIITVVLAISVVVFGLALWRGMDVVEATRFVLAITISVIPEGLPVAISVVLVLGMRRMAARKALVQTMRSIETIGALTTIATDKTGTLTYNRLRVEQAWQYDPEGLDIASVAERTLPASKKSLSDPLDQAIDFYINQKDMTGAKTQPVKSYAFNQELAMSGALWHNADQFDIFIKGAPEYVLQKSNLSGAELKRCLTELNHFTENGYRVVALAHTTIKQAIDELADIPSSIKLEFDGFLAIADQIRPEAKHAIETAQKAGVTVRMITGDHLETAFFIGKKLGMVESREQIFDAREMDKLDDDQLTKKLKNVRVFARVVPEQKFRILQILKQNNITAMTGDGVNDVPALSSAHVGLAMGSGSHIARDAGDIILLDDNFKTIIDALREGRTIIGNVRRMLFYLLSTNAGEMITMIASLAAGIPIPLVPVQILWINLVTDSCMVIPLGLEPPGKDVLKQKPASPQAPILSRMMIVRMVLIASAMATLTIGGFMYYNQHNGVDYARTIAFHVLVVMQLAAAFAARSDHESAFTRLAVWSPTFYIGLGIAALLHLGAIFTPLGQVLHMTQVNAIDLLVTGLAAFIVPLLISELHKLYCRKFVKTD